MKQCILFFVKYPEPGKVKTRLAKDVGDTIAVTLYKAMVADMLDSLKWVEADIIICFSPKERKDEVREWLGPSYAYLVQRGPDLGARMKNALASAFRKGYDRAVLLGSDIPDVDDNEVRDGLDALEGEAACVGPSTDGGYWLIGFTSKGFSPEVFAGIPWSTDQVLASTLKWLRFADITTTLLPEHQDVDGVTDLHELVDQGKLKTTSVTLAALKKLCDS